MSRVKRGVIHLKKRRRILKRTKGFNAGRKNLIKQASTAAIKAGVFAYRDRRSKKRDFRALWQIKISAICKANKTSYSKFIGALKKKKVELDRKVLADLAENNPKILAKIIKEVVS